MAYANVEPRVRDVREKAAALAKSLRARHTTKLSESAEVTALALQMYDADLLEPLIEEMEKLLKGAADGQEEAA
jgi:hypothetical protein